MSASGVSAATSIEWSIVPPVAVSNPTSYASPSIHGYSIDTSPDSSRPSSVSLWSNATKASFTNTCLISIGSGPSLRTRSSISPGCSTVRSTDSSSTGTPLRSSPGASSATNSDDGAGEHHQRHEPGEPRRAQRRAFGRPRLHQSSTSKKPIQPSSANSETWAWNM